MISKFLNRCFGTSLIAFEIALFKRKSSDVISSLIKTSTLESFINLHNNKKALGSLISAEVPDATGYGRIIKNNKGQLIKIIEHKDATNKQKEINEINSGVYIINSKVLNQKISLIK